MGKTWSPGRIKVTFPAGHPQHGLEVLMRRQRVGEVIDDVAAGRPLSGDEIAAMSREEQAAWAVQRSEANVAEFAGLLVSWNFADETGELVPTTVDGVKLLDEDTFGAIQDAYAKVTRRVPPPLPQPSDDGEPSEAALKLPQEPL